MEPTYMNENRYSYLVGSWRRTANSVYEVRSPEGAFEQNLQELFLTGQTHLQHEEYLLALQTFQDAMALILRTVHPVMPVDPNLIGRFALPLDSSLVDVFVNKTADILRQSTPTTYALPPTIFSDQSLLPSAVQDKLKPLTDTGLKVVSFHGALQTNVTAALAAASDKNFARAITLYQTTLDQTPSTEAAIRGGLQHDLAILTEESGDRTKAQTFATAAINTFTQGKINDGQAQALATASGIFSRAGNPTKAADLSKQLDTLRSTTLLSDVVTATKFVPAANLGASLSGAAAVIAAGQTTAAPVVTPPATFALAPSAPTLMGLRFLTAAAPQKTLTIAGLKSTVSISLDSANAATSVRSWLTTLSQTSDIGLLTNWFATVQFVAYLPHMYFYVLPMSIGDCLAGLGNLDDALQSYLSVLPYPFINQNVEIVKIWTRIAQIYLDLGDQAYRKAKDDVTAFGTARSFYENIVRADKTLLATSPLYQNAKFAAIKTRVVAFLVAPDPAGVSDNPAVVTLVASALLRLSQIDGGLNFFGFGPDYVPPFSFEYLQSTARYFAEHASQTEQRYIQYKSQAENEEFRRDQLSQQAEVARQSVILEQRGVTEAERGVDVANASLSYANDQVSSAQAALDDFNNTRWELLELSGLEAWANAASVDQDDEVSLNISGYQYYNTSGRRRSLVVQDLSNQRTQIAQDVEANRLGRAVTSAQSYVDVAQAQVAQAQARVGVAEQRVAIAQLQQRQAEENRDFLDMREFGAKLWFELALQARRLKQRYLDSATEIAFLMERAYNAETERGLRVIRYDYQNSSTDNLMGADMLLSDIDSFTFDHVTTTKTKKNPVRRMISLADAYPVQFNRLITTGRCTFETTLDDFDRRHPGLFLTKIRNVELQFVGLGPVPSITGTLRNIGVSLFRGSDGGITTRLYPADVMVISQYQIRQDALAFRFNPNDLKLFENNGIETMWQLDLPLDANDFDYTDILDVQLVLYYDGFFDPQLEAQVRGSLPTSGSASRTISMRLSAPDELFFLKSNGKADLTFDATSFPRNQKNLVRTRDMVKLLGRADTIQGLTFRLLSEVLGSELTLKTDANGEVLDTPATAALAALRGKAAIDTWHIEIRADDNPALVGEDGALDLGGLDDFTLFFEYSFDFR